MAAEKNNVSFANCSRVGATRGLAAGVSRGLPETVASHPERFSGSANRNFPGAIAPSLPRQSKLGIEVAVAVFATLAVLGLLLLLNLHVGPLWRDEVNTINLAQMPLQELWRNLCFESFPALYVMLLRGWSSLGLAETDAGIRLLGFLIGVGFLASLWACAWWIKAQAPTLSLALLGSLPAFLFTIEANRAYGLAMCLLLIVFGLIWRMLERPSRSRVIAAGLASMLFLHCVYYDAIFLAAMLIGAGLVLTRRKQWSSLSALILMGAAAAATMIPYLPVVRQGSVYVRVAQVPFCNWAHLWDKLNDCLSPTSSSEYARSCDFGAFVWIGVAGIGAMVAAAGQRCRVRVPVRDVRPGDPQWRADLALYSAVALLCGATGYLFFLRKLQFSTQVWYYMILATLCAIALEGILHAGWRALRLWGALRLAFLVSMFVWGGGAVWREAHTRRSDVDMIASVLGQKSVGGDLIVVQDPWVAISFDRYYRAATPWVSIPPIGSHKLHRTDLISQAMMSENPTAPIVLAVRKTLRAGRTVWLVGHAGIRHKLLPQPPPPPRPETAWWFEPYGQFWMQQVNQELLGDAQEIRAIPVNPAGGPVTTLENVPLFSFHGCKEHSG